MAAGPGAAGRSSSSSSRVRGRHMAGQAGRLGGQRPAHCLPASTGLAPHSQVCHLSPARRPERFSPVEPMRLSAQVTAADHAPAWPRPQLLRPTQLVMNATPPGKATPQLRKPWFRLSCPMFSLFSRRLNVSLLRRAQLSCLCSHSTLFAQKSVIQGLFISLEGTIM